MFEELEEFGEEKLSNFRPTKSCKLESNACRHIRLKSADIFDQKKASSYFGVSKENFTIWDDEIETDVI